MHIAGIPSLEENCIHLLEIDKDMKVADKKEISDSSIQRYKEVMHITRDGNDFLIALAYDKSERSRLIEYDMQGNAREFEVSADMDLWSLYTDPETGNVYSWDKSQKALFKWEKDGKVIGFTGMEQRPGAYAKHNGKLVIGCSSGEVYYDGEKVAKLATGLEIRKILEYQGKLIFLRTTKRGGSKESYPSDVLDAETFEVDKDSRLAGKELGGADLDNNLLYAASDCYIDRYDGSSRTTKKINFPKGYITGLHLAEADGKQVIVYNTGLNGICYTDTDFSEKEERLRIVVDKRYRSLNVF